MFNFKKKKTRLVTHSNAFHSDDIFATAALLLHLGDKDFEVIRTRDKEMIESGDIVFDVGFIYDESKNRFDHHQDGGAGKRENGIPYSSFGLVWKKFGKELCGSQEIADYLDNKIAQPVDAMDNGIKTYQPTIEGVRPYLFVDIVSMFIPSWPDEENFDENFMEVVLFAKEILKKEIKKAQNKEKAKEILAKIYNETEDKRIIYLDDNYPWEDILNKYPEPLFVVKSRGEGMCSVKGVKDDMYSFNYRKYLPESWAGKKAEELAEITGVKDVIFCHNARFICSAKSKEGAIKLAQLALEE